VKLTPNTRNRKVGTTFAGVLLGASLMLGTGAHAEANALSNAFNRLAGMDGSYSSTTSPDSFRTRTRHGYSAGGMSMRFSQNRYSLVQIDPPRLDVGCNGIDAHLGGFSYIDSQMIQQMLQQIAQGVVALAFQTAFKQLCPICADVLEFVQRMAQEAAKFAADTCQAAEAIVDGFPDYSGTIQNMWCSGVNMFENFESDWLAAQQETCADRSGAMSSIAQNLADNPNDAEQAMEIYGNHTWLALQAIGIAPKQRGVGGGGWGGSVSGADGQEFAAFAQLMQSWVGTTIRNEDDPDGKHYPPTITNANDMIGMFMCGSRPGTASHPIQYNINSYCEDKFNLTSGQAHKILVCDDYSDCMALSIGGVDDIGLGQGFLSLVAEQLEAAVEAVRTETPMPHAAQALIAVAPFPLYQAINVAATHPSVAEELVMGNAMILGHMISIEYIRHAIARAASSGNESTTPRELLVELYDQIDDMQVVLGNSVEEINRMINVQEHLMHQVDRMNRGVLRNVHSMGIGGRDFARDLGAQLN